MNTRRDMKNNSLLKLGICEVMIVIKFDFIIIFRVVDLQLLKRVLNHYIFFFSFGFSFDWGKTFRKNSNNNLFFSSMKRRGQK